MDKKSSNMRLVWNLARNDFKTRYAGSYLGRVWAFVQPVVTVVLYYFVFEVVFQNRSQLIAGGIEAPYVMWLTAGLVPWFFFSEAITAGTGAMLNYSYLVKKVVFKISLLPIVRVLAAVFTHLVFMLFMLVMYGAIYQMPLSWNILQIPYYSFCMFCLALACSYITCSMVVFFRDLNQIISILLQIGMWATPILWDLSFLQNEREKLQIFFRLNPIYYVVGGYREALFGSSYFWENPWMTLYFWGVVAILGGIGYLLFHKSKTHFADVL